MHRDIKPSNVLINHTGHVKMADFGIMSEVPLSTTFTGTLLYMSPERINGDPYTKSSDIWSFGVLMLAYALSDTPYPKTSSYWSTSDFISKGPVKSNPVCIQHVESSCGSDFADLIRQCTMPDPERRPTAKDILRHPFIMQAITFRTINPPAIPLLPQSSTTQFDVSDTRCKVNETLVTIFINYKWQNSF